jgi:hypothetical protein
MNEDLMLEKRLDHLRTKKKELDEMINKAFDDFTRMRLKKEKLLINDQIMQTERIVYPDVIA